MNGSSIDCAEGRIFYFDDETSIHLDFWQTIDYSGLRYRISYQMSELAAVFPFFQFPDTGRICFDHIPKNKPVDLELPKYYFNSFCNVGIYEEEEKSRIFNDFNPLLDSEELLMKIRFSTSGGIDTTCTTNSNE